MSHTEIIKDMDSCFEIDPITRQIRNTSPSKVSVVQYDHNSERFRFSLMRYIEGHDMSTSNRVEVHYITKAGTAGVYEVTDLAISEEDENKVTCSWLLSQNATKDTGALCFLLRFSCVAEDGTIEYAWNSGIYNGITVADGMYNAAAIVEQYADVLEQWKKELGANTNGGGGASITVDDKISATSTNPVQNRVITEKFASERNEWTGAISHFSRIAEDAKSIALGRATGYVFDTESDMRTWLSVPENINKLVLGDNLYIRDVNVPDYWWDGTKAQQLETQLVDLTEYAKKEDLGNIDAALDSIIAIQNELIGGDAV